MHRERTYLITIRIEEGLQIDNVGMRDQSHDLEFTILSEHGTEMKDDEHMLLIDITKFVDH